MGCHNFTVCIFLLQNGNVLILDIQFKAPCKKTVIYMQT